METVFMVLKAFVFAAIFTTVSYFLHLEGFEAAAREAKIADCLGKETHK